MLNYVLFCVRVCVCASGTLYYILFAAKWLMDTFSFVYGRQSNFSKETNNWANYEIRIFVCGISVWATWWFITKRIANKNHFSFIISIFRRNQFSNIRPAAIDSVRHWLLNIGPKLLIQSLILRPIDINHRMAKPPKENVCRPLRNDYSAYWPLSSIQFIK